MKLQERRKKNGVFKMNDTIDKGLKLLYGHEPKQSYSDRLKASAQRVVFGQSGPIACYNCGLEDDSLLEIHHILDDNSNRSGNDWREIHGKGSEFYRFILSPEKDKPSLVLLCPTCHARRHRSCHKYDKSDHNSCNMSGKCNMPYGKYNAMYQENNTTEGVTG